MALFKKKKQIPPEEIERCREIAAECGVTLRVREFISDEE